MGSFVKAWTESEENSNKFSLPQNYKATVIKAGKEICFYDQIQAQKDDSEIETVLKKYGSIETMVVDKKEILEDFGNIKDLKDVLEQSQKIEELFLSLPVEERERFGHDPKTFIRDGIPYYEKKLAEEIKAKQNQNNQNNGDNTANNDTK